ncbi:hypothetical protein [Synechococcus sp. A15-44]|uniref:hypothetical protein n=1 Tax=Synechococcus sp. A15-44 TaxID=1050646 RepID=UPI001645B8B6|nr:hypothetical protein [Synechococcus sp. A15-44]QNI64115.1 putative conserved secreted protein [Synechococcus sp. A15-44]
MNLPNFFAFFLLGSSQFFLAQPVAVRAQTAAVEFLGTLDSTTESCSFSGADAGVLGFQSTLKLVSSTEAAQIRAVIQTTDETPLSKFSIKAESPSLAYKSGDDVSGEYQNVQVNNLGIGLDVEDVDADLGVDTITFNPTSLTSDLYVGVIFETESDLLDGDYRAVSSLTCFIAAS